MEPAVIVLIVINIAIAAFGYGKLWQKVDGFCKRMDKVEKQVEKQEEKVDDLRSEVSDIASKVKSFFSAGGSRE